MPSHVLHAMWMWHTCRNSWAILGANVAKYLASSTISATWEHFGMGEAINSPEFTSVSCLSVARHLAQAPLVHFLATFDSSCWTNLEPTESLGAGHEGMPEWLDRHRRVVPETDPIWTNWWCFFVSEVNSCHESYVLLLGHFCIYRLLAILV